MKEKNNLHENLVTAKAVDRYNHNMNIHFNALTKKNLKSVELTYSGYALAKEDDADNARIKKLMTKNVRQACYNYLEYGDVFHKERTVVTTKWSSTKLSTASPKFIKFTITLKQLHYYQMNDTKMLNEIYGLIGTLSIFFDKNHNIKFFKEKPKKIQVF